MLSWRAIQATSASIGWSIRERRARVAQQRELHGETKAAAAAAAPRYEVLVGPGEREQTGQVVWVVGHTHKRMALLVGQQLSARQRFSPVL